MELILLCHAATRALKTGCFPTADDPAEPDALAAVQAHAGDSTRVIASPARVARETVACMAQAFDIDPAFDDIDYGRWSGHSIREIGEKEPENIATWLAGPGPYSQPHGGESVAVFAARVIDGIARIEREVTRRRCIVVTHAIVVKAAVAHALGKPLSSIYAMNFAPLSATVLQRPSAAHAWAVELPHALEAYRSLKAGSVACATPLSHPFIQEAQMAHYYALLCR
ncbi:putative phosphoglycerate mutase [Candidatus Paraburkholderia schumanniana]|nr:putative phosphoglycerate mutase [Candidatus Paraburkholderia schumannianae]